MYCRLRVMCVFFCKQKTAYEMRISDWSSDVCSSDLIAGMDDHRQAGLAGGRDMGKEAALLGVTVAVVVEIVEAGLADADHLRVAGQRHEFCRGHKIGRASCRDRVCP